ncbi:putative inositol polyphosphate phosphatase [Aspergillus stella-maris]|uniref:putative inositol polyphosphate phosphatase n=1 Tax=Aspergillus stella-maris TaxID=1810926 RepID=UPI003CCDC936
MEGNDKGKDATDSAPIRPVSSLLSHFEGLSHRRSPSAAPNGSLLKAPELGDDVRSSTRASLDLPRPSPWGSHNDTTNGRDYTNGVAGRRNGGSPGFGSPGRRQNRPMSMVFHSSPQLTPKLTVDSPRSPPRGMGTPGDHMDGARFVPSPANASRESLHLASGKPPLSSRPATPSHAHTPSIPAERKHGFSPSPRLCSTIEPNGASPGPTLPPLNRATKPKIPAKPAGLAWHESNASSASLVPHALQPSGDDRISPFSTPPSSPEKPSPARPTSTKPAQPPRPTRQSPPLASEIPPRRSMERSPAPPRPPRPSPPPEIPTRRSMERSPAPPSPSRRNPRELSASRRSPIPEPCRSTKPLAVQIPKGPSVQPVNLASAPPRAQHQQHYDRSDSPHSRPGLPPRQPEVPQRTPRSPSRQTHALENPAIHRPIPRTDSMPTPKIQRQPSFSRETKLAPPPATRPIPQQEPQGADEPPARTDYPDASNTNRRPPLLRQGPREIHTRYDTRLMDVCGKHVCTTGYITRVWDLTTGEQMMSLSHGETVKSLSLAFKPGTGLEDEGRRVWIGTNSGELHEIDVLTGSIVASRAYPSRREVIKILRHKKEMWTIDDEGRLLVWPPDESGIPDLHYSYHNPHDRVAKGHTFSMVVGDELWLATGKEVHIYRPDAHDDVSFRVLRKPLGSHHTSEVTSGAYTSRGGGRVYLGHADGKVTVYSTNNYACLNVVNVSVYKINCLGIVGDNLWAAYKTGMIYVYDTTTNPWTVLKDWRAHDSPVCGFLLDTSSVWTLNRLQVTSLGTDNCIRLWDGMLEDDWLEIQMQKRDVEFCTFREISAVIMTWNAGASTPGSVRTSTFIQDAIRPGNPPEILVFGFQELVDLENKKITAKSLLLGSKKKESGEKEHMSRQYRVWMEHLTRCINDCMPLEESYVLLHSANLIGLFTCIFVKHKERAKIKDVSAAEVKRGMGGLHGNKGALVFRFILDDSSLCFVNCHLAAGQTQTTNRNNDIAAILETESLPIETSLTSRLDHFVSGGDGSMIMDHEIAIINGDLNYRIDSVPRNVIIEDIRNNNLTKLLDRDQLIASKRKNPGFRLRAFQEAPITFAPTYKYDVGTDEYDSSDKKRSPAWCDRVLYRGLGRVKQLEYRRHEVRASDHRPVSAAFKLRVKTVDPSKREVLWETCQQDFQAEKRRLASEASIEYLISILGMDPKQARALILGK